MSHALTYPNPVEMLISSLMSFFMSLFKEEEEEDKSFNDQANDRSKATMDALFDDDEEENEDDEPEDEDEDEPEDEDEDEPEDEDEDSKDDDLEEEDDDDEDLEEEDDDEDLDDEDDDHESIAQKQAKENGRLAKRLQTELDEANLANGELETQIEALKAEASENSESFDTSKAPELVALRSEMESDVDRVALHLPGGAPQLANKFGPYMNSYLAASYKSTPTERSEAIEELKSQVVQDIGGFEEPYDELLDEEQVKADRVVDKILNLLERNAGNAEKYLDTEAELSDKGSEKRMNSSVAKYENSSEEILEVLESVGTLKADIRKDDPYGLPSIISEMVENDPEGKKKLRSAKRDVVTLLNGPKPLTKKEVETLTKSGKDIEKFKKQRIKNHTQKRGELITSLVEHIMTKGETEKALGAYFKQQSQKKRKNRDIDALDKSVRRKKRGVKKRKKPTGRAADRPSAADGLF